LLADGDIQETARLLETSYSHACKLMLHFKLKAKRKRGVLKRNQSDYVPPAIVEEPKPLPVERSKQEYNPKPFEPTKKEMNLVKQNAFSVGSKLKNRIPFEDLYSAGLEGLFEAKQKFDKDVLTSEGKKTKFDGFATMYIRARMYDWIRIEVGDSRLGLKYYKLRRAKEDELNTTCPITIRSALKWSESTYRLSFIKSQVTTSLNSIVHKNADKTQEHHEHLIAKPDKAICQKELITAFCKSLSQNERILIIGYYFEEQTFKQIGDQLNLSESRLSQMHTAIVKRLSKNQELKELLQCHISTKSSY
jgi:RNA polymerase sigma factor for flagellar operon FliA